MEPALIDAYRDRLGLKAVQLRAWQAMKDTGDLPEGAGLWRVTAVDRGLCTVLSLDADGESTSRRVQPGRAPLVVGDWVAVRGTAPGEVCGIVERRSFLRRGSSHHDGSQQLIAANLDTVFVVAAFATTEKLERRAIRARRLDRFIAAVVEGGATPVVVLNKVDLARHNTEDLTSMQDALRSRLAGVEVLCASAEHAQGLHALRAHMAEGDTVAFIGPSGVGKSSLTNALLGKPLLEAASVRSRDAKGRHTTTRGALVSLPGGALIIDTPGVRQFAVLADEDEQVAGFEDIEALAAQCRFANCGHAAEPGCAVRDAVEGGELDEDRLQSFQQIQNDAERLRGKQEGYARHQQHAADRRFGRMVRQAKQQKKGR